VGTIPDEFVDLLGSATAMYWVLHNLTLSIARTIDAGGSPSLEASLMKEMGTRFEQDVLNGVLAIVDFEPGLPARSVLEQLLVTATQTAPSVTIRGGTNEILRSVAAKGLQPSGGRR
ncbi:MAG: acyl-CoA dehydrogenase family protein, partial [Acidimicrobiales bacterium]